MNADVLLDSASAHAVARVMVTESIDQEKRARASLAEVEAAPRLCFGDALLEQERREIALAELARALDQRELALALTGQLDLAGAYSRCTVGP
jgi:hypothetical protein